MDKELDVHHERHTHNHENSKSKQQHNNVEHVKQHKHHKADDFGDNDEDDYYSEYDESINLEAEALNNTKKAEVDVVIFNRVPKVGSQSMMELMVRLGKVNNFVHSRDAAKPHETIFLKPPEQRQLISDIYTKPRPHIYSQHIAYINFTRFHMPKPIYINLVRDPIERIISWHYYIRAEWYYKDMAAKLGDKAPKRPADEFMHMDLDTCVKNKDIHCQFNQMEIKNLGGDHRRQTLFFCGQNRKLCMPFNSEAAMQKAKRTVEADYAVVGTWEDTNITLSVLEHYIPRFFRNAKMAFYLGKDRLSQVNKNKEKRPVSDLTREILRKNLTREIEFYEFCKQRLYLQYSLINEGYHIDNDDYLLVPNQDEDDKDY